MLWNFLTWKQDISVLYKVFSDLYENIVMYIRLLFYLFISSCVTNSSCQRFCSCVKHCLFDDRKYITNEIWGFQGDEDVNFVLQRFGRIVHLHLRRSRWKLWFYSETLAAIYKTARAITQKTFHVIRKCLKTKCSWKYLEGKINERVSIKYETSIKIELDFRFLL
jgi:hypothetical protein